MGERRCTRTLRRRPTRRAVAAATLSRASAPRRRARTAHRPVLHHAARVRCRHAPIRQRSRSSRVRGASLPTLRSAPGSRSKRHACAPRIARSARHHRHGDSPAFEHSMGGSENQTVRGVRDARPVARRARPGAFACSRRKTVARRARPDAFACSRRKTRWATCSPCRVRARPTLVARGLVHLVRVASEVRMDCASQDLELTRDCDGSFTTTSTSRALRWSVTTCDRASTCGPGTGRLAAHVLHQPAPCARSFS